MEKYFLAHPPLLGAADAGVGEDVHVVLLPLAGLGARLDLSRSIEGLDIKSVFEDQHNVQLENWQFGQMSLLK